jgi:hypothetical protein
MLFVASLFITGCESTQETTLEERNKELVRRMTEEVWNKGNHEIMDELFSTDVVWHFLPDGSKTTSLEELRDHVRNHRKAFPDWAEEIKLIVKRQVLKNYEITYVTTARLFRTGRKKLS